MLPLSLSSRGRSCSALHRQSYERPLGSFAKNPRLRFGVLRLGY
jgi:hypothetical protein